MNEYNDTSSELVGNELELEHNELEAAELSAYDTMHFNYDDNGEGVE